MKKLLTFTLILTLLMSLFAFIPTIMAEGEETDHEHSVDYHLDVTALNKPVQDNVNYYINIKKPEIFASYEDILAVKQEDDVVIKIKNSRPSPLVGAGHIEDAGESLELRNIAIASYDDTSGFMFFTYGKYPTYKTLVYTYQVTSGTIELLGDFDKYIRSMHVTTNEEVLTELNTGISDIVFLIKGVDRVLYVSTSSGNIYRIKTDGIVAVDIDAKGKSYVRTAKGFAVNEHEDIFIYGVTDHNGEILKKPMDKDVFASAATYPNLIDVIARGAYVYILESDGLTMTPKWDLSAPLVPKFTLGDKCIAFTISTKLSVDYLSFAIEKSDNITTYKVEFNGATPSLVFYNHYGANCTCETPHQGWYDSPQKIAVSSDENTAYVIDKSGKRLVISSKTSEEKTYTQHFYGADKLLLDNITDVEVDKRNNLFVASGDKLYAYTNNGDYSDDKTLPLRKIEEIAGFDAPIKEIKIQSKMDSKIFVLTNNNSVYIITDAERTPKKIATFGENIVSMYPSHDSTRVYVATASRVASYPVENADITNPITAFNVVGARLTNIYVDYEGNVFASTEASTLLKYARISDTTYSLVNTIMSKIKWQNLSDFFIIPSSKQAFFLDSSAHLVTRQNNAGWSALYKNADDQYIDKNPYDERLMYVAKTTALSKVYASPVNFEMYRFAEPNEYFYVLAEDKKNSNMYLVVDNTNRFSYIKKTDLTRVDATTNSILGTTLMPLFGSVNVYMYPFENSASEPIDTTKNTMSLVHNVAYDGGKVVWQNATTKWYKVSYVSDMNVPLQGYVKMNEITRSTVPNAPETKVHLRVTTKAGETATLYDAPDLASGIIANGIKNGTLVRLMQEKFDPTSEFTYVQIEIDGETKVGYMLTRNLMENKFTTLQIVSIIVSVLTVLITIAVIILVVNLKKKKDNINTFKSDHEE